MQFYTQHLLWIEKKWSISIIFHYKNLLHTLQLISVVFYFELLHSFLSFSLFGIDSIIFF